jgi:hypothetical protein
MRADDEPTNGTHDLTAPPVPSAPEETESGDLRSRREVVRRGVKIAFVAPVISTFLATDAYAANYSCYPAGQDCSVSSDEPCCNGACNLGVCP